MNYFRKLPGVTLSVIAAFLMGSISPAALAQEQTPIEDEEKSPPAIVATPTTSPYDSTLRDMGVEYIWKEPKARWLLLGMGVGDVLIATGLIRYMRRSWRIHEIRLKTASEKYNEILHRSSTREFRAAQRQVVQALAGLDQEARLEMLNHLDQIEDPIARNRVKIAITSSLQPEVTTDVDSLTAGEIVTETDPDTGETSEKVVPKTPTEKKPKPPAPDLDGSIKRLEDAYQKVQAESVYDAKELRASGNSQAKELPTLENIAESVQSKVRAYTRLSFAAGKWREFKMASIKHMEADARANLKKARRYGYGYTILLCAAIPAFVMGLNWYYDNLEQANRRAQDLAAKTENDRNQSLAHMHAFIYRALLWTTVVAWERVQAKENSRLASYDPPFQIEPMDSDSIEAEELKLLIGETLYHDFEMGRKFEQREFFEKLFERVIKLKSPVVDRFEPAIKESVIKELTDEAMKAFDQRYSAFGGGAFPEFPVFTVPMPGASQPGQPGATTPGQPEAVPPVQPGARTPGQPGTTPPVAPGGNAPAGVSGNPPANAPVNGPANGSAPAAPPPAVTVPPASTAPAPMPVPPLGTTPTPLP